MGTETRNEDFTIGDARLSRVRSGAGLTWLLIPGGPGMGSEYLRELFLGLGLEGSVWSFDLIDPIGQSRDDATVVDGWRKSLIESLDRIGPAVVVGHSFGGMLPLSTTGIERRCTALVLLSSAPDRSWEKCVQEAVRKVEAPGSDALEEVFKLDPSADNFKRLAVSWVPYYFAETHADEGRAMLSRNSFQPLVYQIGARWFLPNYRLHADLPAIPAFCVAGEKDMVTPLCLFRDCQKLQAAQVEYFSILGGGHFPWVENPSQVAVALRDIEVKISRRVK